MLSLLLALQLTAAEPIKYISWWSPDDMPAYHQKAGITRRVSWRATISPTGQVERCDIDQSSGDEKLDALTCAIVTKRGRFKPATWTDGSPVRAVFHSHTIWAVGDRPPILAPALFVEVAQLPTNVNSPAGVKVAFAVHEDGRISDCVGTAQNANPTLVPQACAALKGWPLAKPPLGPEGLPTRSVHQVTVGIVKK